MSGYGGCGVVLRPVYFVQRNLNKSRLDIYGYIQPVVSFEGNHSIHQFDHHLKYLKYRCCLLVYTG